MDDVAADRVDGVAGFHAVKQSITGVLREGAIAAGAVAKLLLRQLDEGLGLSRSLAGCFRDLRNPLLIEHSVRELVAQRLLGLAAGYFGGWLDEGFMRLMDAVQGFPAILSALLLAAVFKPSVGITMVAIGVAFLPVFARLTRASFLEFRSREFVLAARALGAGDGALIGRHILPNTLAPLIVQATISFPVAILAEAALSYLGLGTQPPHPSWGLMLREAQAFLVMAPGFAIFPGTAIALTVLGLNLLGDGLRDLLDPKLSG